MRNFLIAFFCCFIVSLSAQNKSYQKITLISGTTFTGEILVQNDEIIMLKDANGARFQISRSEVKSIETVSPHTKTSTQQATTTVSEVNKGNFRATLEAGINSLNASSAFGSGSALQTNLILGDKNVFGKNIFLGGGIGYLSSIALENKPLSLIPLFIKSYISTTKNRTSPIIGLESGYTFSTNSYYKGDLFSSLFVGLTTRISQNSSFLITLSGSIYGLNTDLTEYNSNGTFNYYGYTSMYSFGLKAGIQF